MIDSTNPRVMADNIKELYGKQIVQNLDIFKLSTIKTGEFDTGKKFNDETVYGNYVEFASAISVSISGWNSTGVEIDADKIINAVLFTPAGTTVIPTLVGKTSQNIIQFTTYYGSYFSNVSVSAMLIEYIKSAAPTPDVLPSPDLGTRTLKEPGPEPEPIEEKK